MDITISKTELQKILKIAGKAVSGKPTLDVLRNIALVAENGTLKAMSSNLDISVKASISCDVQKEGAVTVSAKTFVDFVSLLKGDEVRLWIEGNELMVKAEKARSKFATIPFEEFPVLETITADSVKMFAVETIDLKHALNKTTFAADRGLRQPVFSGVLFEKEGEKLNLVATDGFRLSLYNIIPKEIYSYNLKPVLPYAALDHVLKLCEEVNPETVEMYSISKGNQVLFKIGDTEFSTTLLDGEYPNYSAILPQKLVASYKVSVEEVLHSIKLSNVIVRTAQSQSLTVTKEVGNTYMILTSTMNGIGENESEVSLEIIQEEEGANIRFSPQKMLDILGHIETGKVIFDFMLHPRTEAKMLVLREEGNEKFLHLLTPMVGA